MSKCKVWISKELTPKREYRFVIQTSEHCRVADDNWIIDVQGRPELEHALLDIWARQGKKQDKKWWEFWRWI